MGKNTNIITYQNLGTTLLALLQIQSGACEKFVLRAVAHLFKCIKSLLFYCYVHCAFLSFIPTPLLCLSFV